MKWWRFIRRHHVSGEGGIGLLLPLALPMVVTQSFDTLMLFIDRWFMGQLGPEYLDACMVGGLTAFACTTFFVGLVGYVGALVAHSWGAKRRADPLKILAQGVWISLAAWPLVLLLGWGALQLFPLFKHDPKQMVEESLFFKVMLLGSAVPLLRAALCGYFTGIGRPGVVMLANAVALVVNVALNYALIFGHWGCPRLETAGSALATVAGGVAMVAVLAAACWLQRGGEVVAEPGWYRFDRRILARLFRFGAPCGIEFFLNLLAFNLVVLMMHGYGKEVATAVTIVFSWDLVSFIPMIGVQTGVMTLVGHNLGAGRPEAAARAGWSGFKLAFFYASMILLLFVSCTDSLVGFFLGSFSAAERQAIAPLAVQMLRLAALYVFSDGMLLVFSGALRGAGDTVWTMKANMVMHWLMVAVTAAGIYLCHCPPVAAWMVFVSTVMLMGLVFCLRFQQGRWKSLRVLEHTPEERLTLAPEEPPG